MKRTIVCLLMCVVLTGMACPPPVVEVATITVQYVNTLPNTNVVFQANDADGKFIVGSLGSLSSGGTVAPPISITGKPPFFFSAPTQLGDNVSCSVPTIFGVGGVTDTEFTKFVWRVEATVNQVTGQVEMQCVNDQGTVRRR